MIFLKKKKKEKTRPMGTETPHLAEEGCSTHWGPLAGSPLAAGAEAGGQLRGAGQVGALRLVGHSPLGVSAADVAGALPLAAGHRALEEEQSRRSAKESEGGSGRCYFCSVQTLRPAPCKHGVVTSVLTSRLSHLFLLPSHDAFLFTCLFIYLFSFLMRNQKELSSKNETRAKIEFLKLLFLEVSTENGTSFHFPTAACLKGSFPCSLSRLDYITLSNNT